MLIKLSVRHAIPQLTAFSNNFVGTAGSWHIYISMTQTDNGTIFSWSTTCILNGGLNGFKPFSFKLRPFFKSHDFDQSVLFATFSV